MQIRSRGGGNFGTINVLLLQTVMNGQCVMWYVDVCFHLASMWCSNQVRSSQSILILPDLVTQNDITSCPSILFPLASRLASQILNNLTAVARPMHAHHSKAVLSCFPTTASGLHNTIACTVAYVPGILPPLLRAGQLRSSQMTMVMPSTFKITIPTQGTSMIVEDVPFLPM